MKKPGSSIFFRLLEAQSDCYCLKLLISKSRIFFLQVIVFKNVDKEEIEEEKYESCGFLSHSLKNWRQVGELAIKVHASSFLIFPIILEIKFKI